MNDIILPKELAECELSLEEIGAIFVLYSLKNIDEDSQSFWSTNDKMVKTGKSLVERGIVKFSKNDEDDNIMEIDITQVNSLKKDFWEVHDYDNNDNTIYYHNTYYGDDGGCYRYELHPELLEDSIIWRLKHSEQGDVEGYYPIYSLKEGEDIVKIFLQDEYNSIKLDEQV